jgi:hypothetical protein
MIPTHQYKDLLYPPATNNLDRTLKYILLPEPFPGCTLQLPHLNRLDFLSLAEWEEGGEYKEQPPKYICYTIT